MHSRIRGVVLLMTVLALVSLASLSATPRVSTATVTVMTQNMDAGTDLGFALAYLNTSTPTVGIDLTYQEILQSDFAGRAAILASQISESHPDLVSLQEVTLWSVGPSPVSLTSQFDQLQLLTDALTALGENYAVVDVNNLTTVVAPMSNGDWVGYLDRDVVLARVGSGLSLSNIRSGLFAAKLTIPGTPLGDITVDQGWIAVDATAGGKTLTFVDTHLIGSLPGLPLANLQAAQALELVGLFSGTSRVVIAGDFNSNATHTPPERTPTYLAMLQSGLTDTWSAVHQGNPGFTWPLFVEDPLAANPNGPFERIDLILEAGLGIESVTRVGWTGRHASDHAGVVAAMNF